MSVFGRGIKKLLGPARPMFGREVEHVVAPLYARREELASAVDEMRAAVTRLERVVNDHLDASNEVNTVFGRQLGAAVHGVDELRAEVEALRAE
ncbi:MAG: hypothetical protein ACRDPR_00205, partial [Nocardioidaceae bacterium]